jgi:two-component system, OmpR family, phosphate regulon sensor histidine kinase PhoR
MSSPWAIEFGRLALMLGVFLLMGTWLGDTTWGLMAGILTYLGWHLYNLHRLNAWLKEGRKFNPPDAPGIWGEVFLHLYQLQKRNRSRKRKLKNYLKRFRESTAANPDGTVVLGTYGEIEWWNSAAEPLLGLRMPQDVGQRLVNLVRNPSFTDYLARGDYTNSIEFPAPTDATVRVCVRIVPYGREQRLLVARDVTRLHRMEQVRRDFVANVSHELRTPLTVISGFLETMAEGDNEASRRWGRSVLLMRQQTSRMQRLVEDLLLLSRLELDHEVRDKTLVAVPEILPELVEEARALSGDQRHEIYLEADPALMLRGKERELRSAFSNLLFNAVRYTPDGGRIDVCWWQEPNGSAHFAVVDTGDGIAAHHIPRLTERFYRVDSGRSRERGGTGLGLAIVKHVLTRHRGNLRISSELGKGSTFTCDFPATIALKSAAVIATPPHDVSSKKLL